MLNLNPWTSIWVRPRSTIAAVVSENPNRSLWWLASIYGFSSLLNSFQSVMLGFRLNLLAIFFLAVVFAPIWGYITFAVWSWVVSWTGRWFKGTGSFQTIRAAYAWSCVPLIANIPLWFILAGIFGQDLFTNFSENRILGEAQVLLLYAILIIRIAAAIWSIVIYFNTLAEVQGYSVLRAIGNVIVAGIIIGVAAYVLLVVFFSVLGHSAQAALLHVNI